MSKNLTLKGAAFGALVALGASVFAGAPALAVGDDGNVRLAPDTGAEYDVRASDYFDLGANWSDAVAGTGKYVKYVVNATTGSVKFDIDTNGANTDEIYTVTNGLGLALSATGTTSVTVAPGASTTTTKVTFPGHGLVAGDSVKISGAAGGANAATLNGYRMVASVSGDDVLFTTADTTGMTITGASIALDKVASNTGTVIKLYTAAAHKFQVDDSVVIDGAQATVDGTEVITAVGSNYIQITETLAASTVIGDGSETLTSSTAGDGLDTAANIRAKGLGSYNIVAGRDASVSYNVTDTTTDTNKFIIDTNDADNSGAYDHVLRLVATDTAVTTTATVQAWVDKNDNGLIESDESTSPVRTVRFLKAADITATTTIRPATAGESTVTADVVFTPTLNGNLIIRNEGLTASTITNAIARVDFTRQGDATEVTGAANGSYSNTTKKWTFTSVGFDSGSWTTTAATKISFGTDVTTSSASAIVGYKVSITKNVATITTGSYASSTWTERAHGLRVGDTVTVTDTTSSATSRWIKTAAVVTAVPTTSSFSYAVSAANESATDLASTVLGATAATDTLLSSPVYLRDKVEAGTITAQFYFDAAGSSNVSGTPTAAQTVAAKASYVVGAKVVGASGLAIEGVPSATVSASGHVYKGTTSASAVVRVTNVDGDPVGAGVDVTITGTKSTTGTVTINGTTVGSTATTVYGKTDANGLVTLAITNTVAAENDTLALTADSQGASQGTLTLTWKDKEYTLHDLADSNTNNSVRSRTVASGASYTFNLLAQDQFKQPAGADVRLLVTTEDRTVSQNIVALTAGKATVVVADGGLGSGTSTGVKIGFQKLTNGVWATQTGTDAFEDWNNDSAEQDDLAKVVINYDSSADALTLNENAANYPGNGTGDNAAAVATKALKAIDLRNTAGSAEVYTAAQKATVSGQVTNANGIAKSGSVVTVSGAGLLFNAGNVWALGSVTYVANASGQFTADVVSSTPGVKTVTVTVGSVSKTFAITFTGVSSTARVLTISGAQNIVPGSTLQANILLVDGNGNGVDTVAPATTPVSEYIKVSYDGPGLLSGSALPTETDSDGKATVRYLLGVGDSGTATVTVKFDANFDGDFVDATDITATRVYTIGSAPVAAATAAVAGSTGKFYVSATAADGKSVVVKVAGKFFASFTATGAKKTVALKAPKGSHKVTVFVGGKLTATKTITVK